MSLTYLDKVNDKSIFGHFNNLIHEWCAKENVLKIKRKDSRLVLISLNLRTESVGSWTISKLVKMMKTKK
jgi:hypothetical protein